MTTTDDHVTNWRELVGQPTPEQLAELEYCEHEQIHLSLCEPQDFISAARTWPGRTSSGPGAPTGTPSLSRCSGSSTPTGT